METFEESIEEHEKIVDAILIKDTEGALQALTSNII
jgi:DNA-binding GntR family transcriptional regulator